MYPIETRKGYNIYKMYKKVEEFKHKCPDLMDNWSCNVVDRLMILRSCNETSLVVGHDGHCIYLSLCKTFDYVLVRVDNRWMDTVPLNTPHPKNGALIQPYLIAYFKLNGPNIDKNKEWLNEYIKNTTKLKDSGINDMKDWPYRPIQTNAENCYLRSHNVGYRIRLGNVVYQWFRDQELKSFVFM
ncbi:hypothetical protein RFI_04782 [Reticulomyxa filosa]|uniref:Uncharacterized protein n=1 Tax=Reticulomyxa filosa TaxID=46433 RepID=X6P2G7_RETFI|nr:hypothetical protein RFI_04782 [Reticulomyxa filosa]|eukprot:ETO32333.1 hypothetical protein RFI_04782 [Reticulomyxa filosa]